MENNNSFEYTYSAPQQEEIRRIREKYLPKEQIETKMDQLRKLDRSAEQPGTVVSLVIGIVGTLLFGVGMCCTMIWTDYFLLGIVVGVAGIFILAMAYPAYKAVTRRRRAKIAPQILKLTEELEQNK